jgi:hypothetical protein
MNQLLERNKKQRESRKKDTSIIKGKRPRNVDPMHTIDVREGGNYGRNTHHGLPMVGHMDHDVPQQKKPDKRPAIKEGLEMYEPECVRSYQTDGKGAGVDGHNMDGDWGHKFSGFKKTGLAGNKLHTAELSVMPESVYGPQHRMEVPPESTIPTMEEMHTQEKGVWTYTQPTWC